jgi:serine/threonine protein kinase
MNQHIPNIKPESTIGENRQIEKKQISDYSKILDQYSVVYRKDEIYLHVGDIPWVQGWILDLSVIPAQYNDLLYTILPILIKEKVAFKMARHRVAANEISGGNHGDYLLGKIVSIYPPQNILLALTNKLIASTSEFRGPEILTDRHLGNIVYSRYGAGKPIVKINESGINEYYIYNLKNELIKEPIHIPFKLPNTILWPFETLVTANVPKKETTLQNKYKPIFTLKFDAKGNVKKGLWLKKWRTIKWCVIKEGKKNMFTDPEGRDITDRLIWQFELQRRLSDKLPLPEAYDFFKENGDAYLVMQYIKGETLDIVIDEKFQNRSWFSLSRLEKDQILGYIIQILTIVSQLHNEGYIHRDITPANFLVDEEDKIWMIDLELCYNNSIGKPNPPFRLGTPGFMSPEQRSYGEPSISQDIYAIGSILLTFFTNLTPKGFVLDSTEILANQLKMFIPDVELIDLITNCLNAEPHLRPDIKQIMNIIYLKRLLIKDEKINTVKQHALIGDENLHNAIELSISGLSEAAMSNRDGLWKGEGVETGSNHSNSSIISESFFQGISGVIYILSRAHHIGFKLDEECRRVYDYNIDFLLNRLIHNTPVLPLGLYTGTAGIAHAISSGIESGLISNDESIVNLLKKCFDNCISGNMGIVKGIAGQSLSILHTLSLFKDEKVNSLLDNNVNILLENQVKDGSWISSSDKDKSFKVTGFGHGVAGITCFLLEYLQRNPNHTRVLKTVERSLNWLYKKADVKTSLFWKLNNKTKDASPDFQDGCNGIILCMLKGYEILKERKYLEISEKYLSNYTNDYIQQNLSLKDGLCGIGELYVELTKLTGKQQWAERKNWIRDVILHYFLQYKSGKRYWLTTENSFSNSALLTGSSGIIHFLLRNYSPDDLSHPLLLN